MMEKQIFYLLMVSTYFSLMRDEFAISKDFKLIDVDAVLKKCIKDF